MACVQLDMAKLGMEMAAWSLLWRWVMRFLTEEQKAREEGEAWGTPGKDFKP